MVHNIHGREDAILILCQFAGRNEYTNEDEDEQNNAKEYPREFTGSLL
jgi:hypothetical protein